MKHVAIYTRVSTDGQTTHHQLHALEAMAAARGWTHITHYTDEGISGAKGRDQRPGLDAMLKDVTRGKIDMIAAWSVDRLGRSLQHLVTLLADVHASGCGLYLHQQAMDTTTPSGKAMFQMMGVFAEFERSMISERVKAGLQTARAKGVTLGRRASSAAVEARIRELRSTGAGMLKIAKELRCGVSVVQRVVIADAAKLATAA